LTYKEIIIMDILSFILGMSVVVVIAVAVVAVMAFVKVNKTNKDIKDQFQSLYTGIDDLHRIIGQENENQNKERDTVVTDIYRTMDSRLDKLESKFSKKEKIYESLNK